MPTIEIGREDVLRGKVFDPGWYPVTVRSVTEELSSKGDSTNYLVDIVIDAPENVAGALMTVYFNEKAIGRSIPFVNACSASDVINENTVPSGKKVSIDLEKTVGKKIMAYINNGIYEGRTVNRVEDFKRRG